jgi:N-acetylneuraminic acid mutarotase
MNTQRLSVFAALAAVASGCVCLAHARSLSFEERVDAQEAIERVYHSHRIGSTRSFDEAVSRELLEAKVRRYLAQSAALEQFWYSPVTAEMLHRELVRMTAQTRNPERLGELYAALNDDPVLIQECLARPALVDRLVADWYAFDSKIHADERRAAERLQGDLKDGSIDPLAEDPRRRVVELNTSAQSGDQSDRNPPAGDSRYTVKPEQLDRFRTLMPRQLGRFGKVREERKRFVVRVPLETAVDRIRFVEFSVAKRARDDWWTDVEASLVRHRVETVAQAAVAIPVPGKTPDQSDSGQLYSAACMPDDYWSNGSLGTEQLQARVDHTAVWTGSEMIIWGGDWDFDGWDIPLKNGGRYDPATHTWSSVSRVNAPWERSRHTAVWTGDEMIVWGGYDDENGEWLFTGGRYDPVADQWDPDGVSVADAPSPREYHTAVWTGDVMVVWGGFDGSQALQDGGRYNPDTNAWSPTTLTNGPFVRYRHTAIWSGDAMFVWGGYNGSSTTMNNRRYDPQTDTWTGFSGVSQPVPRYGHTAAWAEGKMMVWGGQTNATSEVNSGGIYDPATNLWSTITTTGAPYARTRHSAVWTGSEMIVWGGAYCSSSSCNFRDTGGRYNPSTNSWAATSTSSAPSERADHTAIWADGLMLVWGGGDEYSYLGDGGRYSPGSNSWTSIPVSGFESRHDSTAVWTGSEVIVWGGDAPDASGNTGIRYDPALDLLTSTTMVGAPEERQDHTAVWTGSEMIVWGGSWLGYPVNSGGRYDPLTESWRPMSTGSVPARRRDHTAIWTGSEMIVWGGFGWNALILDYTVLGDGGRYDPVFDIWTPIDDDGPSYRAGHTALWTGDRMLVWGGWTGVDEVPTGWFDDGWSYVPAVGAWSPIEVGGAPAARAEHTAVWTGDEMIVWGGEANDNRRNDGGRFDPTLNSWQPVATTGAPSIRSEHTAVWTGSRMIVWGGHSGSSPSATGGRYDPVLDSWQSTRTIGAPSPRYRHTAVWTGTFMIVLGGFLDTLGGRYALGHSSDDDGDGYSECGGDCNDDRVEIYPGGAELCDGLDNDCNRLIDDGAGAPGPSAAPIRWPSKATLYWLPEPGVESYDLVRGDLSLLRLGGGDFLGSVEMCLEEDMGRHDHPVSVSDTPSPGKGYYYVYRPAGCGEQAGTYSCGGDGEQGDRDFGINGSIAACE